MLEHLGKTIETPKGTGIFHSAIVDVKGIRAIIVNIEDRKVLIRLGKFLNNYEGIYTYSHGRSRIVIKLAEIDFLKATRIRHSNNAYSVGVVTSLQKHDGKLTDLTFMQEDHTVVEYSLTGKVESNLLELTDGTWIALT